MPRETSVSLLAPLMALAVVVGIVGLWWWFEHNAPQPPTSTAKSGEEKPRVHREAALLFVNYPPEEAASVRNPHVYKGRPLCQRCHVQNTASLTDSPVDLCRQCHTAEHRSHRLDVRQSAPMKRGLHLGPKGALLCHTCHHHHDIYQYEHGLVLERDTLCAACHDSHPPTGSPP